MKRLYWQLALTKVITMAEVEEASEKVSMGPERRSHIVSEKDRKLTAYHESGHAIVAHLLPSCRSCSIGNNHSSWRSRWFTL